jgi:hypothetical protein
MGRLRRPHTRVPSSSSNPHCSTHDSCGRHPHSIDALTALPSSYPSAQSTILTGSSDGLVRAVQLYPTKLLGVVADHGQFPVERLAVDMGGQGRWVGSAGHEEGLKMTDLREVFEDEEGADGEDDSEESGGEEIDGDEEGEDEEEGGMTGLADLGKGKQRTTQPVAEEEKEPKQTDGDDAESGEESDVPKEKKRKRKKEQDPLSSKGRKKGRNQVDADTGFFADL